MSFVVVMMLRNFWNKIKTFGMHKFFFTFFGIDTTMKKKSVLTLLLQCLSFFLWIAIIFFAEFNKGLSPRVLSKIEWPPTGRVRSRECGSGHDPAWSSQVCVRPNEQLQRCPGVRNLWPLFRWWICPRESIPDFNHSWLGMFVCVRSRKCCYP